MNFLAAGACRELTAAGRLAAFFAGLRRRIAAEAGDDLEPEAKPESAEYTAWYTRRRLRDEEANRLKRRLAALETEAAADVRPKAAVEDPDRLAWQRRHHHREQRRVELREAEAFSTFPEDPAPVASQGLTPFLAWVRRQDQRRTARAPQRRTA